jgi:hypothetical protein
MSKTIQKETEYGVKANELSKVAPDLEGNLEQGDVVNLTVDENIIDEVLSYPITKMIDAMGIKFINKSPEEKAEIKRIVGNAYSELKAKNLVNIELREDDTPEELRGLYGDEERVERAEEYGVKTEDFNTMMEELKKSNAPSINISENINPRIKKADLVSYLKNKK